MKYLLLTILYLPLVADYTISYKDLNYTVTSYKQYGDCIVFKHNGEPKSLCRNYTIKEK